MKPIKNKDYLNLLTSCNSVFGDINKDKKLNCGETQ